VQHRRQETDHKKVNKDFFVNKLFLPVFSAGTTPVALSSSLMVAFNRAQAKMDPM
jgi:hypothetical protein